mmetsp:Transcript_112551/g.363534  ORF Transcript_112551/g.363534 Transcript_112551/m.363534 type:complete len:227 (+) Transcript_112551:1015-1695(+)
MGLSASSLPVVLQPAAPAAEEHGLHLLQQAEALGVSALVGVHRQGPAFEGPLDLRRAGGRFTQAKQSPGCAPFQRSEAPLGGLSPLLECYDLRLELAITQSRQPHLQGRWPLQELLRECPRRQGPEALLKLWAASHWPGPSCGVRRVLQALGLPKAMDLAHEGQHKGAWPEEGGGLRDGCAALGDQQVYREAGRRAHVLTAVPAQHKGHICPILRGPGSLGAYHEI